MRPPKSARCAPHGPPDKRHHDQRHPTIRVHTIGPGGDKTASLQAIRAAASTNNRPVLAVAATKKAAPV